MKIIVIYHRADFDGLFSREIAKRHFGDRAEYLGWDYNDPLPDVPRDAKLYMIDISVKGLMDHPGLVWIDHHKSAIEEFPRTIYGYRIDGVAACRLAWQWFNNPFSPENPYCHPTCWALPKKESYVERTLPEPAAVRLAGEYDIWDHRNPDTLLFQHGLRSQELDWTRLLQIDGAEENTAMAYVSELLACGRVLQKAQQDRDESVITRLGFTLRWEGLTFIACNSALYNSHLFTAGLKPEHDACLGFKWDGVNRRWSVSMYGVPGKPDLDLSAIAVRYGGGGHKQACGFVCTRLPFPLDEAA